MRFVRSPRRAIKLASSCASSIAVPRIEATPDCAHRAFLRIADVTVMHSLIIRDIGLIDIVHDCVNDEILGGRGMEAVDCSGGVNADESIAEFLVQIHANQTKMSATSNFKSRRSSENREYASVFTQKLV